MCEIYFRRSDDQVERVSLSQGETVLNGLLNRGVEVPYGCLTGVCQSCLLRSTDSEIPEESQKGLSASQKKMGYFLSCCCRPKQAMIVSLSNLFKKETSQVLEKEILTDQVARLRISKALCYRSGQFLTLWKSQDVARTYSIASHPSHDDFIEFHVRLYDNGVFSPWIFDGINVGDEIEIQGPMGECFYNANGKDQPMLLSGIGTGLAPLYGIARDALLSGHTGRILLLIGSRTKQGLYYEEELKALQRDYPQLEVKFSVSELDRDEAATKSHSRDIYSYAKVLMPDLAGAKVFLCGGESFVRKMRRQCFLNGANMDDIASDIFLCFPS